MGNRTAEQIASLIRNDLFKELNMASRTSVSVSTQRKNKHSDSMILNVGEGEHPHRVFVKYGAHFSGGCAWDIQSEFEGYALVFQMNLDPGLFFAVRPLLFRKDPDVMATMFVQGRMLQGIYKKNLMRFSGAGEMEKSIYFTKLTAQWLKRFSDETRKGHGFSAPLSTVTGFCRDRMHEIVNWNPTFDRLNVSEQELTTFIEGVFQIYPEAEVQIVRNHGDFAPHNILIDNRGRLGVIDIGFSMNTGNPLPFEDAAAFLIYLEQMRNNPLYRPSGIQMIIGAFLNELADEDAHAGGEIIAAYVKKLLAHLAWLFHPNRKPVSRWTEYSFRRWGDDRMKWLAGTAHSGERKNNLPIEMFLYKPKDEKNGF